jgi:hypothetical protein
LFDLRNRYSTAKDFIRPRKTAFVPIARRIAEWYHGLFHLAQATIHDRWVKRLRLVAFLSASSIATQLVLRSALGGVGLGDLLPSSVLAILVASAVWLVAYPAMWLRMLAVVVEMEAKKEYAAVLKEIHKLHPHRGPSASAEETAPGSPRGDASRR